MICSEDKGKGGGVGEGKIDKHPPPSCASLVLVTLRQVHADVVYLNLCVCVYIEGEIFVCVYMYREKGDLNKNSER